MPESAERIVAIKNANMPEYRFEWHPSTKRVYVIRLWVKPHIGDPIAMEITDHGAAINAVMVWTRGFKEGRAQCLTQTQSAEKGLLRV